MLTVQLDDVTAKDIHAEKGGVIRAIDAKRIVIMQSVFSNNEARDHGGVIFWRTEDTAAGTLVVRNSKVTKNAALSGGAFSVEGPVVMRVRTNCRFVNNSAQNHGGAIRLGNRARLHVSESEFLHNNATLGGSIHCRGESGNRNGTFLNVTEVLFEDNAAENGGGIYLGTAEMFASNDTRWIRNRAKHNGGAICAWNGARIALLTCKFRHNHAKEGGAISGMDEQGNKLLIRMGPAVQFENNTAGARGGALHLKGTGAGVETGGRVTFSANTAGRQGGGIFFQEGYRFVVGDSVFQNNKARRGGAICARAEQGETNVVLKSAELDTNEADCGGALYLRASMSTDSRVNCSLLGATVVTSNRARRDGGAIYSNGSTALLLNGTEFIENRADETGGAIAFQRGRVEMKVTGPVIFERNEAEKGGAVFVNASSANASLAFAKFDGNVAKSGGGLYIRSSINLSATDSEFVDNIADDPGGSGGAVFCEMGSGKSILRFTRGRFVKNSITQSAASQPSGTGGGAVYVSGLVHLILNSIQFNENKALNGGGVFLGSGSRLNLENSNLTLNQAEMNGGAVYLREAIPESTVQSSNFASNSARQGGALYFTNTTSSVELDRLTFHNNTAENSGGALAAEDASVKMNMCRLSENSAGEGVWNLTECPMDRIHFRNRFTCGGAVHIDRRPDSDVTVAIEESEFERNNADAGGALSIAAASAVRIKGSTFASNTAWLGGALVLNVSELQTESSLQHCSFVENAACQGGAVYGLQSSGTDSSVSVLLIDPVFEENFAMVSAAALHTQTKPGAFHICCQCSDDDLLTPLSAAFLRSFPRACVPNFDQNSVSLEGYGANLATDRVDWNVNPLEIQKHRSGDLLEPVRIADVDAFGQEVPFSDAAVAISVEGGQLGGDDHTHLHKGAAVFEGVILRAPPGNYLLEISVERTPVHSIPLSVAVCPVGQGQDGLECVECEDGEYSMEQDEVCRRCPDHATCREGRIIADDGYWISNTFSTDVVKCIRAEACESNVTVAALYSGDPLIVDACVEAYEGPLCGSCAEGHGHTTAQECENCNERASRISSAVLIVYFFLVVVMLIKSTWSHDLTGPPLPCARPRLEEGRTELNGSTDTLGGVLDGEVEESPVPTHLEPVESFGIRGEALREIQRFAEATTSASPTIKETVSAPATPGGTSRSFCHMLQGATTSNPGNGAVTENLDFRKTRAHAVFSIEDADIISETHILLKPLFAEALKILLTFFQSVSLALYIQVDWPPVSRGLLELFSFLGTSSSPYFSLDCIFSPRDETSPSIQTFIFLLLVPIFLSLLLIFFWVGLFLIEHSISILWQRVKNSLVVVFYLSFLPVCHLCFRAMNCVSLSLEPGQSKEYVWIEDTDVICYKSAHQRLVLYFCAPLMILTVGIFPLSFLVFLLIHKSLGKTERLRSWGLLFEAYKYKRRYWEFTIFLRKLLLAAIFAFDYHFSIQTQTLVGIGVIVFFLLVHSINSPYEKAERMLTHMETMSLFGAFVVYFAACLVHALDEGNEIIFIILAVIIIAVLLRLFHGLLQHLIRSVDWTLGEFGREDYISRSWVVKFCLVSRLKCSFCSARMQRVFKRWTSHS